MLDDDAAVVELDGGMVCEREGLGANRLDADCDGPKSAATCDERDTNFLYSYLSDRQL